MHYSLFYDLERTFSALELTEVLLMPRSRTMKTTFAKRDNQTRTSSLPVRSALLGVMVILVGSTLLAGVAKGSTFNNVQIFVKTSSELQYSYSFSAYNLTGSLIGSYQGSFPAAAFELPSGDYLFTVSAIYQNYNPCYVCAYSSSGAPVDKGATSSLPAIYYQPKSEY